MNNRSEEAPETGVRTLHPLEGQVWPSRTIQGLPMKELEPFDLRFFPSSMIRQDSFTVDHILGSEDTEEE